MPTRAYADTDDQSEVADRPARGAAADDGRENCSSREPGDPYNNESRSSMPPGESTDNKSNAADRQIININYGPRSEAAAGDRRL
ncbi:unnamed protein product [Heligmosomoides polygyrus]|uniref:Uncharacterized protein n=1 Tax=Heligmosomoides polygyrus TaxID=6339 RepID=A0A183G5Y3_HELPZ|nr:unnamed protein product [Heligmosomoides polygyrus]